MIILSHRGYWKHPSEKNTVKAFVRSFMAGFGVETDIRDHKGTLVISHDIPGDSNVRADLFFEIYVNRGVHLPLALNIKSDGLQKNLKQLLEKYSIENYYVFDMSVPDALTYLNHGFNVFARQSEYEDPPSLYKESAGIWVDGFEDDWIGEEVIATHLANGKKVCLVSPELHNRHHKPFWNKLKKMAVVGDLNLMLCTDFPSQANEEFNVKN